MHIDDYTKKAIDKLLAVKNQQFSLQNEKVASIISKQIKSFVTPAIVNQVTSMVLLFLLNCVQGGWRRWIPFTLNR